MTRGRSIRRPVIGVVAFVAIATLIFIRLLGYGGVSLTSPGTYNLTALVPNAVNLVDHADVREAGIKIGQVSGINIAGDHVALSLAIDPRYAPIYSNATVLIRAKSLAGENYVSIAPGGPPARALRSNGVLPLSQAPESTQIDQLLSAFGPRRRRELQRILDALGIGLQGRGQDLNQFIDGTTTTAKYGLTVTQVVDADRQQVKALMADFGQVAQGLASRGQALRTLAADARSFSTAVAVRDRALEQTLTAIPPFLIQARRSLYRLGGFSHAAVPVVDDLRGASNALLPAITHLASASDATRLAVEALGRFAPRGRSLLDGLATVAPVARRFMGPLETTMRQSNPGLAYLDKYASYVGWAISELAASVAPRDAKSHLDRGIEMYGGDSVDNLSPQQRAAVDVLTQAGALEPIVGKTHYNPYPPPGHGVVLSPFKGKYPRLSEDPPYTLGSR